ncbi:hypothetical protein [Actinomycetospora sp. TBRC 11914]|uniref:hypothetical protein n=1 Tax=Actinomycetospora sp. TBRC 11914 TaxID=2729387 RepID=UPI00145F57D4|nr:hypothetical protein [Actinomycetospora sp. TBRC 11914]NMO91908.1 hypothetical protein [Actinomycetospora sp. TBRC 11914]
MAGTARRTRRRTGRAGRSPGGRRAAARVPGALPVQLLPHLLAAGDLPRARVGDVLEVVPAVYAGVLHPAGPFHGATAPDFWSVDEFGCLDARGTVTAVALDPAGGCTCRIDVLDAAGWLVPVNWAATEPPEGDGPLHVEGSLYLDPVLHAGSPHGEAVALCRRRFRVAALRRYRRTAGRPVRPVALDRVPSPAEASEAAVYIADLVPEREDRPAVAGEAGDHAGRSCS